MRRTLIPILILFLGTAGCSLVGGGTEVPDLQVADYGSLVEALRASGATVEPAGEIEQPFFSVPGQVLQVDGKDVQVFEYESPALANEAAVSISSDGSAIGTTMVSWIEPPHFYQAGKLIVLYVGTDARVQDTLSGILGPQIAGG